jgi:hypothetical protein
MVPTRLTIQQNFPMHHRVKETLWTKIDSFFSQKASRHKNAKNQPPIWKLGRRSKEEVERAC